MTRPSITIETCKPGVPLAGCSCGIVHTTTVDIEVVEVAGCVLTPGDPVPAGRCLKCGELVYPKPSRSTRDVFSDVLDALKLAEAFMAGFEDDEVQDGINEKLATIREAIHQGERIAPACTDALRKATDHEVARLACRMALSEAKQSLTNGLAVLEMIEREDPDAGDAGDAFVMQANDCLRRIGKLFDANGVFKVGSL